LGRVFEIGPMILLIAQAGSIRCFTRFIDDIILHDLKQVVQNKGFCQKDVGAEFFSPMVIIGIGGCGNEVGLGVFLFDGFKSIQFIGIGWWYICQQQVDLMALFEISDHFAGVFERQYLSIDAVGHHMEDEIPRLRFIVDHCDLHIPDNGVLPVFVMYDMPSRSLLRPKMVYSQAHRKSRSLFGIWQMVLPDRRLA